MTLNQHKIKNYVIIASLKIEKIGKLMKRIPGSRRLVSSLPGSDSRTRVLNHSASLAMSTSVLKALPGKLDIKRHSPTVVPIKSDSDEIFCLQLLSKIKYVHSTSANANRYITCV